MFGLFRSSSGPEQVVGPAEALPGRAHPTYQVADRHAVLGQPLRGPWPGCDVVSFGMGCFWGAERKLWQTPGVVCTSVGYQGGYTPNPTYRETCTGLTGHVEVVRVAHDPSRLSFAELLRVFWEGHDPTQGMRQGNDTGTVYRSAIYPTTQAQLEAALASRDAYQARLTAAGYGRITTEIRLDPGEYWLAEDYHQQYLHKNPDGYCGLGGTGVSCPVGLVG